MYSAFASHTNQGSYGTTRLHMDAADAINIMTFASPCPDGSDGCAVWDIFKYEDSSWIREYIQANITLDEEEFIDPIHSQHIYLDDDMRKELYECTGVCSYRIYQRPGDAIFIPAGCAHQVRKSLHHYTITFITSHR